MTSPHFENILDLYRQALSVGVVEYYQKQSGSKIRRGIYSAQLVLWLMILQRLHAVGTLAAVIQLLQQGAADLVLQNCVRVREKRISSRTGGYSQARQKLPTVLCKQVNLEITEQLRELVRTEDRSAPRVYVVDGSSLELEPNKELLRSYPPARNQHGASHWPVLRMVVMHELGTGLAEEPQWGPMYGEQAVSEQALAEQAMSRLPGAAVVLGDRNFGVLWVAYEAHRRGLRTVLRLTEARARKIGGGPISEEDDRELEWKASRWDGGKTHRVPAAAAVTGRLIAARVGRGKSKSWLYLFTTLDWPVEKIVELYGNRWNIETDLRSLKRTARLHHMAARSPNMLEKELLMATAAYNLVRSVMCLAARKHQLGPRQLSFAMVLNVVDCAWPKLATTVIPERFDAELLASPGSRGPMHIAQTQQNSLIPSNAMASAIRLSLQARREN